MVADIPEERVGTFARDIMLISAPRQTLEKMNGSRGRVGGGRSSERHHD